MLAFLGEKSKVIYKIVVLHIILHIHGLSPPTPGVAAAAPPLELAAAALPLPPAAAGGPPLSPQV
jgi:hypothetical protein